jgi:hypothetical protein
MHEHDTLFATSLGGRWETSEAREVGDEFALPCGLTL